jgi:hypothetical protein
MQVKSYQDLNVWKESMRLTLSIYKFSGLYLAQELGYAEPKLVTDIFEKTSQLGKQLRSLIKSLQTRIAEGN